ncbi:hypothetical protein RSAG8_04964, partial [Rhizoctonia solani AG-8 WAC10335]
MSRWLTYARAVEEVLWTCLLQRLRSWHPLAKVSSRSPGDRPELRSSCGSILDAWAKYRLRRAHRFTDHCMVTAAPIDERRPKLYANLPWNTHRSPNTGCNVLFLIYPRLFGLFDSSTCMLF